MVITYILGMLNETEVVGWSGQDPVDLLPTFDQQRSCMLLRVSGVTSET